MPRPEETGTILLTPGLSRSFRGWRGWSFRNFPNPDHVQPAFLWAPAQFTSDRSFSKPYCADFSEKSAVNPLICDERWLLQGLGPRR